MQLPDPPPTPEKLHFLKYGADYEAVVELARDNRLASAVPDRDFGSRPPQALKHVSAAGDMLVLHEPDRGLVVHFNPLEPFYHPVVYVEFDAVESPCPGDPHVEEKIDDHWYVCEYDWN